MPPRKIPEPASPDQGAFFGVEVRGNGVIDLHDFHIHAQLVTPDGGEAYFPPSNVVAASVPVVPVEVAHDALRTAAIHTRNRREGNRGKHSALDGGEGGYEAGLRLGKFLPGFGPVRERNWKDAKAHARTLDAERAARAVVGPTLDSLGAHDVQPVVEAVVGALTIDSVPAAEPFETQPRVRGSIEQVVPHITSEQKLDIIREKAGFNPSTHGEKNTATGLIFSTTERGDDWVHSYLMETYDHLVKHYKAQGNNPTKASQLAGKGVESRVSEMGDYVQAALDDGMALQWLQKRVDATVNPHLTLEELVSDSFEPVESVEEQRIKDGQFTLWAIAAVVRHRDLASHQNLPFLPLTEREDRSINFTQEGKNKQLYNPYVAAFMLTDSRPNIMEKYAAIREHVLKQVATITTHELRALLPRMLDDERRRYRFWRSALEGVRGPYKKVAQARLGQEPA